MLEALTAQKQGHAITRQRTDLKPEVLGRFVWRCCVLSDKYNLTPASSKLPSVSVSTQPKARQHPKNVCGQARCALCSARQHCASPKSSHIHNLHTHLRSLSVIRTQGSILWPFSPWPQVLGRRGAKGEDFGALRSELPREPWL